jgi:hypothetical protein
VASAHLKGSARFTYIPEDDTDEVTLLLAVPLLDVEPAPFRSRFEWWSTDASTRAVVNVGESTQDIFATIRCENQPAALTAMLREALENNVVLSYAKEESATPIVCRVVAIEGAPPGTLRLQPDPERYGFGEYAVRLHLRAVGTDDWSEIL